MYKLKNNYKTNTMKTKLNNIGNKVVRWFFVILAMVAFASVAALLGNWMKDKIWTFLVLDGLFYLCLWFFLKNCKHFSDGPSGAIKVMLATFAMAIILFLLAAATLGLLEILWVRLNIIVFFFGAIATLYFTMKKIDLFD